MRTIEREIMIGLSPNNVRGDDREKIKPKANEGKYFLFLRSTETFISALYRNFYFCVVQKQTLVLGKKSFLKIFAKVTGKKPVLESLFTTVAGLQVCNFVKKRLQQRYFPLNFAEFFRTPIL